MTATVPASTTFPASTAQLLSRPEKTRRTYAILDTAPLVDALAFVLADPDSVIDRGQFGRYPESLIRWQARAVECLIKHRTGVVRDSKTTPR